MNRRDVFEMTMCLPFKLLHCLLDYHFLNSISMTALLFFTEKSYELSSAMSKYDNIESELEIVEKFDESQLEETCVLVEEERIHVPHGPIKHKSYKVGSLSCIFLSCIYSFSSLFKGSRVGALVLA